jgi:hypothetical protein
MAHNTAPPSAPYFEEQIKTRRNPEPGRVDFHKQNLTSASLYQIYSLKIL